MRCIFQIPNVDVWRRRAPAALSLRRAKTLANRPPTPPPGPPTPPLKCSGDLGAACRVLLLWMGASLMNLADLLSCGGPACQNCPCPGWMFFSSWALRRRCLDLSVLCFGPPLPVPLAPDAHEGKALRSRQAAPSRYPDALQSTAALPPAPELVPVWALVCGARWPGGGPVCLCTILAGSGSPYPDADREVDGGAASSSSRHAQGRQKEGEMERGRDTHCRLPAFSLVLLFPYLPLPRPLRLASPTPFAASVPWPSWDLCMSGVGVIVWLPHSSSAPFAPSALRLR